MNDTKNIPTLMSIRDAASFLGMSRTAVFMKVKSGEIRSIRIGKEYLIRRSSLARVGKNTLSAAKKKKINRAVQKVVREYGELLRRLGDE